MDTQMPFRRPLCGYRFFLSCGVVFHLTVSGALDSYGHGANGRSTPIKGKRTGEE